MHLNNHGIDIVDIEASGLHFDSYPIEIAVLVNGLLHVWLIKPESSWTHWCNKAEALHGISRGKLKEEGVPASVVVDELTDVLSDASGVIYSDADRWDEDWLSTLFFTCRKQPPVKVLSIFDLMSDDQKCMFNTTKEDLCSTVEYRQHRALDDVKIINEAFLKSTA